MEQSLKNYREELSDILLRLLWRQWCTFGVSGNTEPSKGPIVDPEALLLLTCSVGRSDPRLFDEMMDWLSLNWELVNISRINFMLKKRQWQGGEALGALSNWMTKNMGGKTKWASLTGKAEPRNDMVSFFIDLNGAEMAKFGNPEPSFAEYGFFRGEVKLRKHTQDFRPDNPSNLLPALRSFFGTNVRAEIVAYLLTHPNGGHPSLVAREIGYYQKTAHQALVAMGRSGLLECRDTGREKIFRLNRDLSDTFLSGIKGEPTWIQWPPICFLLERVWYKMLDKDFLALSPQVQSIELREALSPLSKEISHPAFAKLFSGHPKGDGYIHELVSGIRDLVRG